MHIFANKSITMKKELIKEEGFSYIEKGEGRPIIILHGLMGGLSNFQGVFEHFPLKNYKVIIPELPVDSTPILKSINSFTNFEKVATFVFKIGVLSTGSSGIITL